MEKRNRTVPFIILILLFFVSWSFAQEKKYPPYPDVWGYEFPWPEKKSRNSFIDVTKMPDGDYMVTYMIERRKLKRKEDSSYHYKYEGVSFFSGRKYSEDEFKKIRREDIKANQHITFDDGCVIEQKTEGLTRCANSFDRYIIKKDKNGTPIAEKMLLYLYSKSIETDIDLQCERNWGYKKNYFFKRLENVFAFFVPLENGSFLLFDKEGNFIIRFDKYFKTRSSLINNKIFLINRAEYTKIQKEQSSLSKIDDQSMNNVMSNYLTNLKREEKK